MAQAGTHTQDCTNARVSSYWVSQSSDVTHNGACTPTVIGASSLVLQACAEEERSLSSSCSSARAWVWGYGAMRQWPHLLTWGCHGSDGRQSCCCSPRGFSTHYLVERDHVHYSGADKTHMYVWIFLVAIVIALFPGLCPACVTCSMKSFFLGEPENEAVIQRSHMLVGLTVVVVSLLPNWAIRFVVLPAPEERGQRLK